MADSDNRTVTAPSMQNLASPLSDRIRTSIRKAADLAKQVSDSLLALEFEELSMNGADPVALTVSAENFEEAIEKLKASTDILESLAVPVATTPPDRVPDHMPNSSMPFFSMVTNVLRQHKFDFNNKISISVKFTDPQNTGTKPYIYQTLRTSLNDGEDYTYVYSNGSQVANYYFSPSGVSKNSANSYGVINFVLLAHCAFKLKQPKPKNPKNGHTRVVTRIDSMLKLFGVENVPVKGIESAVFKLPPPNSSEIALMTSVRPMLNSLADALGVDLIEPPNAHGMGDFYTMSTSMNDILCYIELKGRDINIDRFHNAFSQLLWTMFAKYVDEEPKNPPTQFGVLTNGDRWIFCYFTNAICFDEDSAVATGPTETMAAVPAAVTFEFNFTTDIVLAVDSVRESNWAKFIVLLAIFMKGVPGPISKLQLLPNSAFAYSAEYAVC